MRSHRLGKLPCDDSETESGSKRYYDYVLFSPSTNKKDVYPTTFDSITGLPTTHAATSEFSENLTTQFPGWEPLETFVGIVGYFVIGTKGYLVVVRKAELAAKVVGHNVLNVKEFGVIELKLSRPFETKPHSADDLVALSDLKQHLSAYADVYYYCEGYDLTRPWGWKSPTPSDADGIYSHADSSFTVNEDMASCLHPQIVTNLVQGYIRSKPLRNPQGLEVGAVVLLSRRCLENVGRRSSRGLNGVCCPANEYECEFMMWEKTDSPTIQVRTFMYRRGTVPIFWRSILDVNPQFEQILVRRLPHKHSEWYYHNIARRYEGYLEPASSNHLQVRAINLLRSVHCPPEESLSRSYQCIPPEMSTDKLQVSHKVLCFDWHGTVYQHGVEKTIEEYWATCLPVLEDAGMFSFTYDPVSGTNEVTKRQKCVVRVNCKDSLDRANIGVFYLCVLSALRIASENSFQHAVITVKDKDIPPPTAGFQAIRDCFSSSFASSIVDLFLDNGDRICHLYANSIALHTSTIARFHVNTMKSRKEALGISVSLNRRIENGIWEEYRIKGQDLFLNRQRKYFAGPCALTWKREVTPNPKDVGNVVLLRNVTNMEAEVSALKSIGPIHSLMLDDAQRIILAAFVNDADAKTAKDKYSINLTDAFCPPVSTNTNRQRWFIPADVSSVHEVDMIIDPNQKHKFRALDVGRGAVCVACEETIYNPCDGLRCTCCGVTVHQDTNYKCFGKTPVPRCRDVIRRSVGKLGQLESNLYYSAEEPKEPVGFYRMTALICSGIKNAWLGLTN